MTETEGVIKYQLLHTATPLEHHSMISGLNAWRSIMHRLKLIGQEAHRYHGLGFGNISQRLDEQRYIISGTQTGAPATLSVNDYCLVEKADPWQNKIASRGPCKPSSEALTHASVYQQNPAIKAIIHVHCPEIWLNTKTLQLPATAKNIAYGTPEMASAVFQLLKNKNLGIHGVFTMLGHEDGVVAFGRTLQEAAADLMNCLARSFSIVQNIDKD